MKILLIGNETEDTDILADVLAKKYQCSKNGLLSETIPTIFNNGVYHTSVVDLHPGQIIEIINNFDIIKLADQEIKSYPHYKTFVTTARLFCDLEEFNVNLEFRNNKNVQNFLYWKDLLLKNKSFCFYPFLALIDNWDSTTVCPKSSVPITRMTDLKDWNQDPSYLEIRNNMAAGIMMPDRCGDCYSRELEGQESTRQYETLEWTQRLNLTSVEDFFKFNDPVFYEIRPSSKCNIMCRTCDDFHSDLIKKEFIKIKIPLIDTVHGQYKNTSFDTIKFETLERIYIGGGEPTVMPELYKFLQSCIDIGNTSFELNIGTNGMFFSNRLVKLLDNFNNVCFSFSYDGYEIVNDYIRWKSKFTTMIDNARMLKSRGHRIGLQTVFSMYNLTRMHDIFNFFDEEYLGSGLLVQVGNGTNNIFMPFNHPCPELVVDSMLKTKKTKMYFMNGRSIKSMIDLLHDYYADPNYKVDIELLRKFYEHNDKLDASRGSRLIDYIPELAEARKIYNL